jgi:hypothetical protein
MATFTYRRLVSVFPMFWALAVCAAPADNYTIKLFRPSHTGDRFDWNADKSFQSHYSTSTKDGQRPVVHDRVLKLHLESAVTVEAVDATGHESRITCEIRKCTVDSGDGAQDILPAGSVLTAEMKGGKKSYSLKGGALTPPQLYSVDLLISLAVSGSPTMDDVFPAGGPMAAGARWQADAQKLAESLRGRGLSVDARDLSGTAAFLGIQKVGDTECAKVNLTFDLRNAHQPTTKPTSSDVMTQRSVITLLLPVDTNRRVAAETIETQTEDDHAGTSADGEPFAEHTTSTMLVRDEYSSR